MNHYTYSFEKLEVWKLARTLRVEIYGLTDMLPVSERYGLIAQTHRAVNSICHNLAEGSGRSTMRDKSHFTRIALGSGYELLDQLIAAFDLNYISELEYSHMRIRMDEVLNKLNAYYRYQNSQR